MRTIFRILTLVLVGALPVLMHPGSARAADAVLDQSQTESWTDVWRIGGGYLPEMAQTVTAGTHGIFYKVSLYLNNVSASNPVSVSIQTVIDGEPSGNEIGYGEIPADELPSYDNPDWVDVVIGNVPVIPGTQFAVVVSSEISITGIGTIQWYSSGNVYPQGIMLVNGGSGWSSWSVGDAMFQTYVLPDKLDQIQADYYPHYCAGGPGTLGQTFTAGMSGYLDRVSFFIANSNVFPVTILDASIQTVTGEGYPSGIEIGHGSIPGSAISPYPAEWWSTITINDAYLLAGTQYAIVLTPANQGYFDWYCKDQSYAGGEMFMYGNGWSYVGDDSDATFQTYVAQPVAFFPGYQPPPPDTPCSDGICPAVTATVTPNDSTARITSNVEFRKRQNGTVHGILTFNDSRTGEIALRGCTTDSTACRLTVTKFSCTDENTVTIIGNYTPKGEDEYYYELNLSGVKNEIGTFTLILGLPDIGNKTYTFTRNGIVDVICPPVDEVP